MIFWRASNLINALVKKGEMLHNDAHCGVLEAYRMVLSSVNDILLVCHVVRMFSISVSITPE